jgi:hypothetical protein
MRLHSLRTQKISAAVGAIALLLGLAACSSSGSSSYVPAAGNAAAPTATSTPQALPSKGTATCINCGTNSRAVGS